MTARDIERSLAALKISTMELIWGMTKKHNSETGNTRNKSPGIPRVEVPGTV